MFEGDEALKKIGVLSGGEKSRVMLGKLLLTPVNLLLLDEPTNHLDMESSDALLAAVDSFDGAVIMVTHNEMLLNALAERLIIFQNERVSVFEGSYQQFLENGGWEDEEEIREPDQKKTSEDEARLRLRKKELRRRRSEIITERAKILKPLEQRITRVENDIESHEKELNQLNRSLLEALQAQQSKRIIELSQSIHRSQSAIDQLFYELEELTTAFEIQNARFAEKLEQTDTMITL